jgi:pimeloyl-ACP methyl ester carboxylesterase
VAAPGTRVVFIHGLWLHGDSWEPWVELFREAGYEPTAPGWPGDSSSVEETRSNPDRVAGHGIDDVVEHYARIIGRLQTTPIRPGQKLVVIGHSFGGIIVQRLLGEGRAAAGVAIDPAPIRGIVFLPPSSLRVASVALRNPLNRNRAVALTRKQFRYGFGNAISAEESDELYNRWTIPSPGKPLFEVAFANLSPRSPAKVDTRNPTRGPLLITAGEQDRTVPPAIPGARPRLARGCRQRPDLAREALSVAAPHLRLAQDLRQPLDVGRLHRTKEHALAHQRPCWRVVRHLARSGASSPHGKGASSRIDRRSRCAFALLLGVVGIC